MFSEQLWHGWVAKLRKDSLDTLSKFVEKIPNTLFGYFLEFVSSLQNRVGQFGWREVVYATDGADPEGGTRSGSVHSGGQWASGPVQEVCSDGEEDGRHKGTLQG